MVRILKISVKLICLIVLVVSSINGTAQAQLKLTKKINAGVTKIETPDNYQYLRNGDDYVGIAMRTVFLKKATGNTFHLVIKYTGSTSLSHLAHLTFGFRDSVAIESNLKLIRIQKTDNPKLNTKVFEASLTGEDLALLQQKPLVNFTISFSDKKEQISIPVNDGTFMQAQITALQQQIK